ncbi:spermatogenesis-associated protein 46 [Arvicanthis niloticus]|uniref:spermatogenesis-associated protein 46 n=1 Tax=Arvicanthis niloticus TaxID=61156 RepID=UPI0014870996|nr:spermatogenesis-associated protein 46 [Arvicanthis niloticus]
MSGCVISITQCGQNMENFSLLSTSRPRISSSALSAFPDIMSSLATSLPDLGDTLNGEQLRQNCTIYRPWFSPYSYLVCKDKESHLEAYGFPEVDREEGRGDNCLLEDVAESVCSSSSSQENTYPRETNKKSKHGLDSITSQDILMASKWHPAQQNGYKCAACCRMYPTLHSLKSHIKGGFKEGFSCKVYYRKLKTLWGKEQKARIGDRISLGSCQAFK